MTTRSIILTAAGVVWVAAVGIGMGMLLQHDLTSGRSAAPPEVWPTASRLVRPEGRPTLVLVLHPRCPCSRASMGELAWILARCRDRVTAFILVHKPENASREWMETDVVDSASAMPGVQVVADEGGRESRLFQALTSGQTLLYDADGSLVFRGGITPSRGHAGDSAGREAIVARILRQATQVSVTPVFGCAVANRSGS